MGLDCYEFGIMKVAIKLFFTVQVLDFGGKKLQLFCNGFHACWMICIVNLSPRILFQLSNFNS